MIASQTQPPLEPATKGGSVGKIDSIGQTTNFHYEATFRVDLGSAIPEIGDLMQRLNDGVSSAGYHEKISLTHDGLIPPMVVTVNRELTEGEQYKMKRLIESQIIEAFPKYDVRLTGFRRKPGNVSQSAS